MSAESVAPKPLSSLLYIWPERTPDFCILCQVDKGENTVIGRNYFARQAATLFKFAKLTNDPNLSAVLVKKAADLTSQVDETGPPPDQRPRAPDVERPT